MSRLDAHPAPADLGRARPGPGEEPRAITDLATALELDPAGENAYVGHSTVDTLARPSIYGGQVAAQALRAGGLTVPSDRLPHSLHAYYLRAGDPALPVHYDVDRRRDGRSFSARHVTAAQNGAVIFEMLASFHVDEPSPDVDAVDRGPLHFPDDAQARGLERVLEVREVTHTRFDLAEPTFSDAMWIRSAHPLPDDPLVHACALTYASDLGSGFGQMDTPGLGRGGTSIDHSLWFHAPLRLDDWVSLQLWPSKARRALGVYQGAMRDRAGTLGALLSQEVMVRPHR